MRGLVVSILLIVINIILIVIFKYFDVITNKSTAAAPYLWNEGTSTLLSIDCGVGAKSLPVGDKVKVSVDIEWYVATGDASFTHVTSGDIYTTISAS